MTTGMEVVLSPGSGGGDAGSPFRNEDVREWSRIDRVTGMLERARVETDRWQADTRDAKQSYGKVTDSRQRNSADGSLVQKARRQVEIFQSQGNGGRNFQVVRASQWSSSRALDVHNKHNYITNDAKEETMNGGAFNSPRLSLWRPSLADTAATDLDRLSYLCRKLHDEALSNASFFNFASSIRTPSPTLLPVDNEFEEIEDGIELGDEKLSLTERRSNSNEDLPSLQLVNGDESNFARDCKTRRSLQIPENGEDKGDSKVRRTRAEMIAERAKRFEQGVATKENGVKKSFISTKTFTPIANNDFVKNDPMHPSKFNQVAKISIQDNAPVQNGHHHPSTATTRKANNKTVVHLRNASSPDAVPPRCINVTAIKLDKDTVENRLTDDVAPTTTTTMVNGTKPVKKVEFCKTEIHFAADSGKVNIVETDGKPPPTNKFRRRRRNHSLNSAINPSKSNLPVVHFGDTSYEKYIFGGGKVPPPSATTSQDENKTDNSPLAEVIATRDESNNFDSSRRDTTNKEIATTRDSFTDTSLDRVLEHVGKFRGAHTTTVNFLSDESKALTKISDDKPSSNTFASATPLSPTKSPDQVLTKIVTTHKPVVARVDEHPPTKPSRLKNQTDEEKVKSGHQIDAKEHCDNNASDADDEPPVYENIFDAVSDGVPLYENFHQVVKTIPVVVVEKPEVEKVVKKPLVGSYRKVGNEGSNKVTRSVRSSTPKNEKERSSSRSRDSSIKRRKEAKVGKEDGTRNLQAKKGSSAVQERKGTPTNLMADKNIVKTKKPVEVVYKTAVYNMKNEKLSKPSKPKESKGPRLINELICGTKLKKPSDSGKKIIKTAIVSQSNNGKKKDTPTAVVVNR